jgi:hypothetical protein
MTSLQPLHERTSKIFTSTEGGKVTYRYDGHALSYSTVTSIKSFRGATSSSSIGWRFGRHRLSSFHHLGRPVREARRPGRRPRRSQLQRDPGRQRVGDPLETGRSPILPIVTTSSRRSRAGASGADFGAGRARWRASSRGALSGEPLCPIRSRLVSRESRPVGP